MIKRSIRMDTRVYLSAPNFPYRMGSAWRKKKKLRYGKRILIVVSQETMKVDVQEKTLRRLIHFLVQLILSSTS